VVYLDDLERKLLSTSSERDLSLYRFLNGRKHSIKVAPNDIESELCSNAFDKGDGQITLSKLRGVKPFKGFHYSNNLVLLIAAAKIDIVGEEQHIRGYLAGRGHKEQLVINTALDSNYRIAAETDRAIDNLAYMIQEGLTILEKDIQNCLSSINDLYDLFIVEKAIARSIFQSNEEKNFQSYSDLVDIQNRALKRIEIFSFLLLFLVSSYILYLVVPIGVSTVVENWDTLEPIAYMLDKAVMALILITGVVLATKVKSIKSRVRGLVLLVVYKLLGVDYSMYTNLKKTIELE
jgi:hypothetical protein